MSTCAWTAPQLRGYRHVIDAKGGCDRRLTEHRSLEKSASRGLDNDIDGAAKVDGERVKEK